MAYAAPNHEGHRPLEANLVFSSRDGFVFASWPGTDVVVRLGQHAEVAAMMSDFLAQDALGARLSENGLSRR